MDIEDLYAMIPDLECEPGCTECCRHFGVPSRTRVEDARIKAYLKEHGMEVGEARGNCCPYVSDTGCLIHPVRPLTCRMYGASPNYRCKRSVVPLRLLHADEEAEIFHLYKTHFF